jgi:type IV/VI secretion system ImpK/VasF family protein
LTGGFDEGYGSASSSHAPAEGPEEERSEPVDAAGSSDFSTDAALDAANEAGIPRNTRPFRAWGAAHERDTGPSMWERFVGWVRGIFIRPKSDDAAASAALRAANELGPLKSATTRVGDFEPIVDEFASSARMITPAADDFGSSVDDFGSSVDDFASSADVIGPTADDFTSSAQVMAPAADDFEPASDVIAPAADDFASSDDFSSSISSAEASSPDDADPLWDAPVVAEAEPTAPPSLEASDFADVWTPRGESAEEPAAFVPEPPKVEAPKKKGFFARLFSRRAKEPDVLTDEHRAAAAAWESEVAAIQDEDHTALEPADADFADSADAAAVPAIDDFALDDVAAEAVPPSIDHSAADAATLAAVLGSLPPKEPSVADETAAEAELEDWTEAPAVEEPVTELSASDETWVIEAAVIEETPVAHEAPPVVDDAIDESLLVELPEPAMPAEPPPSPAKEVDVARKPGFFSALLRRVSRSQFIPKAAAEPVPEPIAPAVFEPEPIEASIETEAEADVENEVVETEVVEAEVAAEVETEVEADAFSPLVEPPAAPAFDVLSETLAAPMPVTPPPAWPPIAPVAPQPEFEATQPFPAFRDARDDFADDEPPQEPGRPTEKVEIPAFDDGEKTDEFEAVPAPTEGTAETRQVAGLWGRMFGTKVEEAAAAVSGEAASPAALDDKTPFVLAKFRTFYNEIIRDKHQKSDVISGFATAVMGSTGMTDSSDPEFAAQLLSKRLSEMLELQAAESNWTGGDAAKYYPEAQYAMVALADETFATTDWTGRASWHKYMLEPRMYGTRGAELEFFKRIDKLLKEAPQDKGARDLARLYLLVIASGFRGKFRVPNVRRPLAEYRRRLYEYSHQADPLALYERDRRIVPEAAEHTLASRAVGRFTSAQKWIAAVLVLMVLYVGFSHYAWSRLSADLKDVMSRIENTDAPGRAP